MGTTKIKRSLMIAVKDLERDKKRKKNPKGKARRNTIEITVRTVISTKKIAVIMMITVVVVVVMIQRRNKKENVDDATMKTTIRAMTITLRQAILLLPLHVHVVVGITVVEINIKSSLRGI